MMKNELTVADIEQWMQSVECFCDLQATVDRIIATMKYADLPGVINWGDLGYRDALIGVDDDGLLRCQVVVEKAFLGKAAFCRHIERELAEKGYPNVEVCTEW